MFIHQEWGNTVELYQGQFSQCNPRAVSETWSVWYSKWWPVFMWISAHMYEEWRSRTEYYFGMLVFISSHSLPSMISILISQIHLLLLLVVTDMSHMYLFAERGWTQTIVDICTCNLDPQIAIYIGTPLQLRWAECLLTIGTLLADTAISQISFPPSSSPSFSKWVQHEQDWSLHHNDTLEKCSHM